MNLFLFIILQSTNYSYLLFQVQRLFTVNLTFSHFDLRIARSLKCLYSSVLVKDTTFPARVHGTYCGRRVPWTIYSSKSTLLIRYMSKFGSTNNDSFTSVHQVVDASLEYTYSRRHVIMSDTGNGSMSIHDFGPVLSSNRGSTFEWLLKAQLGHRFSISLREYIMELGELIFFDGPLPYVSKRKILNHWY